MLVSKAPENEQRRKCKKVLRSVCAVPFPYPAHQMLLEREKSKRQTPDHSYMYPSKQVYHYRLQPDMVCKCQG